MSYKVFLVEDEIVAREGIRDNVDWRSAGFEFCGEAPDGEMALPLIEKTQPDVIITDIKMPFMDGLQLSRIVREQQPWVKMIILSGHDEFEYAQAAIKLGVTEYLLKPINAREIHTALQSVASTLDQEKEERENLKQLQRHLKEIVSLRQERLLLQLVVGGITFSEAIEQCRQIGLNIIAHHYLVIVIKAPLAQEGSADFGQYRAIKQRVGRLVDMHPQAFLIQKSVQELVLIMNGENPEALKHDGAFLAELIQQDIANELDCRVWVGVGSLQQRLTDIYLSFGDALSAVDQSRQPHSNPSHSLQPLGDMMKLDRGAIDQYMRSGLSAEFDAFFRQQLKPVSDASLRSDLIKHYLFVDVVLSAVQFVTELGGDPHAVLPVIDDVEGFLVTVQTSAEIKQALRQIFTAVLSFRNQQAQYEKTRAIFQARDYIDAHFANPNLLLNDVAATVNLSPSHFSVVFARETGESFKDYLTRVRIERAKELLRTTNLKCSEVAYQSGYNDPHYFSTVFRKQTGLPPQQFRQLPHS